MTSCRRSGYFMCVLLVLASFLIYTTYLKQNPKQPVEEEIDTVVAREFGGKPLVFWSNDFHIGPIQDLKHLLQPLGVKFIDKSLSGHCHLTKTCANNLQVINRRNGINLDPSLIPKFYEQYSKDSEMKTVDAFVCFHPSSMCELFMPFNKSMIVIASTRYEMGRHDPSRWQKWNENLVKISRDPKNVIGANNLYDAKYIEYFTGLKPKVLTSFCGYIPESYKPTREGFLLAPVHKHGFEKVFFNMYAASCKKAGDKCPKVMSLRGKYPHYKYSDLTAHQGIVYVPYQVSVMSLFEQYRMNIPLFFPSMDLLAQWQFEHHIMNERTWDMVFGATPSKSKIPPHETQRDVPDPNCETNKSAIRHWIQYADFYKMPHITLYESVDDLVVKLNTVNLTDISAKMVQTNIEVRKDLNQTWTRILNNIALHSANFVQLNRTSM